MAANLQNMDPAGPGESTCPHLALREDQQTCMSYPSHWNLCHRCRPPSAVRLRHQRQACLTQHHSACPVFQCPETLPLPDRLRPRKVDVKLSGQ